MAMVMGHTERVLDQEIDTLQICPQKPNYMILGTYSLSNNVQPVLTDTNDNESVDNTQFTPPRVGSIRVLLVEYHLSSSPTADQILRQCRLDLPCAVLDIRFCPTDNTLIAAATSIGELRFFRIGGLSENVSSGPGIVRIIPLGIARISGEFESEDNTLPPLITQLAWLQQRRDVSNDSESVISTPHYLAACDTTGQIKLVQVSIPDEMAASDQSSSNTDDQYLLCKTQNVHKHLQGLEAWTISTITLSSTSNTLRQLVISGGDDGCLIASTYTLSLKDSPGNIETGTEQIPLETPPRRIHLDKQTHMAGVVAIFPLIDSISQSPTKDQSNAIPILTGSYDQQLRLFLLDPATLEFTFVSSLELAGGVWRVALMDSYRVPKSFDQPEHQTHYVLLVSAMYTGAYIIRLIKDSDTDDPSKIWSWQIDTHLSKPHESMVYACAASEVADGNGDEIGKWKVITTSFYDKRICVWDVVDNIKAQR